MKKLLILLIGLSLCLHFSCNKKNPNSGFNSQSLELNKKALLLTREEKYDSALILLNKTIEIDENFYPAYVNKMFIFNTLKDYKNALAMADQQVRIVPNRPEAWLMDGIMNDVTGDSTKAKECYNRSISLYNTEISKNEKQFMKSNKFNKAIALILLGKGIEAQAELKELKEQFSEDEAPNDDIIDEFSSFTKRDIIKLYTNTK